MAEATINWDEDLPSGSSAIRLGDDDLRSLTTSLGDGLDAEHHWANAQGVANRGLHRKGSGRAYLDVQSNLSDSGTSAAGKIYVTSDTSRAFYTPDSGVTGFLGGHLVPEVVGHNSVAHYPGQNARFAMEFGVDTASVSVAFTNAYETPPVVTATSLASTSVFANVSVVTAGGFLVNDYDDTGALVGEDFHWISLGTLSF
jgi:hypothetical protein